MTTHEDATSETAVFCGSILIYYFPILSFNTFISFFINGFFSQFNHSFSYFTHSPSPSLLIHSTPSWLAPTPPIQQGAQSLETQFLSNHLCFPFLCFQGPSRFLPCPPNTPIPHKMKTHKASAKRFRVTGRGKIVRRRAGKQHLLAKKNTKRKLRLSKMHAVSRSDYDNVIGALPYLKVNRNAK
ncbi:hypothetical protein ES319_D08G106600v1 [Gossypium barbadense]|uniref:50S ribosomal protein L35 n=1 Tax=Gossypium barbadense TaxID=3634 RepID=A0A5J5QBX9_GOSBA|nr:hypothetical protein ES319_D08G106600v1 [Gossypium barbadense]